MPFIRKQGCIHWMCRAQGGKKKVLTIPSSVSFILLHVWMSSEKIFFRMLMWQLMWHLLKTIQSYVLGFPSCIHVCVLFCFVCCLYNILIYNFMGLPCVRHVKAVAREGWVSGGVFSNIPQMNRPIGNTVGNRIMIRQLISKLCQILMVFTSAVWSYLHHCQRN